MLSQSYIPCTASCNKAKSEWPELVGWSVDDAAGIILRENPSVIGVVPLLHGKVYYPLVYCCERVIAWVNDSNVIVSVPRVG